MGETVADDVPESDGKTHAGNVGAWPAKVRGFTGDVVTEIRKTSWPTRQELVESTWVVIVMVLALGMFIAVCDKVLIDLLGMLVPRG
jgi:preprotein translocase subunit SecE